MTSRVLDQLKTVKEKLEANYSTEALLDTLDELLNRAVEGIIICCNYLDHRLLTIATWYSTNQRRKLSSMEKPQFIASCMAFALADTKTKRRIYRKIGLERNLTVLMLDQWLTLAGECVHLELKHLSNPSSDVMSRINHLRWLLNITNPHQLFASYNTVKMYYQESLKFREQVSEKFMRKVMLETVAYVKEQERRNGPRMNLNDVAQNFMLAVYKAIDKCDSAKGTLTSYVDAWINNAKTTNVFRDEVGVAYSIPSGQRKQIATKVSTLSNYAVSIDDDEVRGIVADQNLEENLLRQDTINHVRKLAKAADPSGLGRLVLGITETLSVHEVLLLSKASTQQLGEKPDILPTN